MDQEMMEFRINKNDVSFVEFLAHLIARLNPESLGMSTLELSAVTRNAPHLYVSDSGFNPS